MACSNFKSTTGAEVPAPNTAPAPSRSWFFHCVNGKGSWRNNVFVERLWKSVKYEEAYLKAYDSVAEARASIGCNLDFYNREGRIRALTGARRMRPNSIGHRKQWRREFRRRAIRNERTGRTPLIPRGILFRQTEPALCAVPNVRERNMRLFENMFLNIGAMKSGTSWLAKQLEDHPDIFVPPIKEIHYFAHCHSSTALLDTNGRIEVLKTYVSWINRDLNTDILRHNLHWFDMYLDEPINDAWFYNLYKNRGAKKYCAEFSNITSILNDEAWTHIKGLSDNIKVTYTIRDPVMRLWSHIRFQASINGVFEYIPQWGETEYRDFLNSVDVLQHSCYSHTISTLRRNLEPHQFLVLYFEDFRSNPLNELRQIERFLSVSRKNYDNLEFNNPSLPLEMPEPFILASRDAISAEFDKLDKLGVPIPNNWTLPQRTILLDRF